MPRQCHVVNQYRMIADDAVVTYMDISHQQVVIADGCLRAILHSTPMNGYALTDDIVIADNQARGLIWYFQSGVASPILENW